MKVIGSLGVLACLSALCLGMPACNGYATVEYTNPIYENDFPDPAVLRASDGMFYVYATNGKYLDGSYANIRVMKSADLVHWTECADALPVKAKWADQNSDGFYWAPHVVERASKYFLYFSANHDNPEGKQMMGIGVAVADRPEGPFVPDDEPLVWGEGFEHIDPFVYIDPNADKAYFYWGSGFKPLKMRELADDLRSFKDGSETKEVVFLTGKDYEILLEGPWMINRDGYYYMFYSGDNCCGDKAHYAVLVARSETPEGPFTPISEITGQKNNAVLVESGCWTAPGHNAVVMDDEGNYWMLYHAINRAKKAPVGEDKYTNRELLLDRIEWTDEGWPQWMQPSNELRQGPSVR